MSTRVVAHIARYTNCPPAFVGARVAMRYGLMASSFGDMPGARVFPTDSEARLPVVAQYRQERGVVLGCGEAGAVVFWLQGISGGDVRLLF